ncbi:APC family permease, partial [Candidatus Aenigmatarchaeota archaeon]
SMYPSVAIVIRISAIGISLIEEIYTAFYIYLKGEIETMREKIKLKRELGLFETTLAGIGIILGAGIYVLVGKAAGLTGTSVWMSFFFASLVAAFTGLSYAELSSLFPRAGAEYVYTKKAFGRTLAFLVGWAIILSGIFASTTVALGFAGYFSSLFGGSVILISFVLVLILSFTIFYGIKQSTWIAIVFTLIEAAGLVIIIFISIPYFGSVDYFQMSAGFKGMFSAGALIFFAFLGFEQITRLSEETKKPKRVIPRALIISIVITTIFYVLVAISVVSVLSPQELAQSSSPLADVAAFILGPEAFIVLSIVALFSTANTVLLEMLATSRIVYGMADFGSFPRSLSRIHKKTRTPWVAIIAVMIFTILFLFAGNIEQIASITDFALFVTFAMINLVAIVLRYKLPKMKRSFRIPLNIGKFPVISFLGLAASLFMLANLSIDILIYGAITIVVGLVLFKAMIEKRVIAPR